MPNPLLKALRPVHPGEILREDILPAVDRSKAEISRLLGIPRSTFFGIVSEKQPVIPAVALRLARMFGGSADVWVRMQSRYDLRIAEATLGDALNAIPLLKAA